MDEILELTLESPDGIIDCRLEPQRNEDELFYNATILYPNVVNGFSRSEIFCHDLHRDTGTGDYLFEPGEDIHPKIKKLESRISAAIVKILRQK
jgi:hypothetical protein